MAKPITFAEAREMPLDELIQRADEAIAAYDKPEQPEDETQLKARLTRTLDETPALYRWFLTLQSYFDHRTDGAADQLGRNDWQYKNMRQRRDAMERAASAAKRRYEGASRLVTILIGEEQASAMPKGR